MPKSFETNQQVYTKDHGEITLYQRSDHKNPKWQTRIKVNGSTGYVRKSCGTVDEFNARAFAETLYESLVEKFKKTGSTKTKTFKSVVVEWLGELREREVSSELINEFEERLNNYPVRFWSSKYIDEIQDADLREFLSWRKANGKRKKVPTVSTIKKDLVPLRQVFDYAYAKKYIAIPLKFESFGDSSERRPDFTEKEWQEVLNKILLWVDEKKGDKRAYRDRFYLKQYILILGNSGIRAGTEHQSITWDCIEYHAFDGKESEQLVIRVPKSKVARPRWVVPSSSVRVYLQALKKFREEELKDREEEFDNNEPIFCRRNGEPILSFKIGFKGFLENYGLLKNHEGKNRVPYSLRHTYATRHIRAGINHWDLARNMGTSVEELEKHYVHDDHTKYGLGMIDAKPAIPTRTLEHLFEDSEEADA